MELRPTVPLLCVSVHSAWKGHLQNDLFCVGQDVKPYSLTHSCTTNLQRIYGLCKTKTSCATSPPKLAVSPHDMSRYFLCSL